jgi:hypothetical protein
LFGAWAERKAGTNIALVKERALKNYGSEIRVEKLADDGGVCEQLKRK